MSQTQKSYNNIIVVNAVFRKLAQLKEITQILDSHTSCSLNYDSNNNTKLITFKISAMQAYQLLELKLKLIEELELM